MEQQQQKRTAVQRIDDLENGLMGLYRVADSFAKDIGTLKEAIKLLGNKVDAIVKATMAGEDLNDDVLTRIMVENNVADLKNKVDQLVMAGTLVATTGAITENDFIVGQEVDDSGKVVNPRLQFVLSALQPELRDKIKGAKVGDSITFQEGKLKLEIKEAYSIVAPKPPEVTPATVADPFAEVTMDAAPVIPATDQNVLPVEQSSSNANSDQPAQ